MGNNDGDRKKKKEKQAQGRQFLMALRQFVSYKVTEEPDGTLVCNVLNSGRLAKSVLRFWRFHLAVADKSHLDEPAAKGKKNPPKLPRERLEVSERGRPVMSTPLHPGRSSVSPTKFNHKPGPKGKAKNSLLPALPAASRILQSQNHKNLRLPVISPTTKRGFHRGCEFHSRGARSGRLGSKRWNSVNYTLRHDEAIEMADLVEATSLTIGSAILVLGPSLDHEAEQLQDIDWLTSDAEPIDHTGAPIHQSQEILAFRYDPARVHWLLFEIDLSTEEMICYEPLSQHGEALDMAGLVLIAKFFKPGRAGNKPPDGVSCGFWMATTAFLIICGIPITKPIVTILRALKPSKDWALKAANNFLRPFGHGFSEDKWRCVARRPEWISRFNPEIFQQDMDQHIRDKRRFNQQRRRQVAPSSNPNTSDGHLQLELLIQDLDKESRSLTFGHESLRAEDLRRFMDGWANDEVINIPPSTPHFASAFGVGLPSCNVKIMSTFFYPKLCKVLQARQDADGSAQT
ncbi:hypothetical protein B0H14DRAFT_2631147 [Mycena olivaceomarginata]|nr:hypothetical protein B0H14DRAFT_2631147 [Mycena olivaceomarginata]